MKKPKTIDNPFADAAEAILRPSIARYFQPTFERTINDDTGEIFHKIGKRETKFIKEHKVSIFPNRIKKIFNTNLTPGACKLWLMMILSYTDKNHDQIYIHWTDTICSLKISRNTYYKSIKELKEFNIVESHESKPYTYYVNPLCFYAGDRVQFLDK